MKQTFTSTSIISLLFLHSIAYAINNNENKTAISELTEEKSVELSANYFIDQTRQFAFSENESKEETDFLQDDINMYGEYQLNPDSGQYYIQKAEELLKLVEDANRFIDKIDPELIVSLPVGIKTDLGGLQYILLIEEVNFRPEGTFFNALMTLKTPKGELTFRGRDIPFSFNGGLKGEIFLELVTPIPLKFGEGIQVIIKADQKSYAVWDCHGFKRLGISADVIFSDNFIVPENPDGTIAKGKKLISSFAIEMADWNDLIVSLSLPAFQISGVEGVGFLVENAVLDFSDRANFAGMAFPQDYSSSYFVEGNKNLWRGFYIKHASVSLPKELGGEGGRISVHAYDLLIDDQGFSGEIIAKDLLSLEKGKIGNWAFSLDAIGVKLKANQLTQAGFNGKIVVPVFSKDDPLLYKALIDLGGKYSFTISTTSEKEFPIFSSKVTLAPTSFIEVVIENKKFKPRAVLHGTASIKLSNEGVELAAIAFEALEINSSKPYIKVGGFSFGSEALQQSVSGFPISINDIALKQVSDEKIGLSFTIILNLVGEGDGGFGAGCGLTVVGEMDASKGIQSWKYSYMELTKLAVNIDAGAFKIIASIEKFKNDEFYGTGFKGQATIEIINLFNIEGTAMFGKVDGYRYWYADATALFSNGIPIGMFALNKFGGGVFHHMRQIAPVGEVFSSEIGMTNSGIVYRPDKEVPIGIKATVGLILNRAETIFNGDATLEIAFNEGGGVRTIDFRGNASFMTPKLPGAALQLAKLKSQVTKMTGGENPPINNSSSLSAMLQINMNFPEKILHANLRVYVNVAQGIIKGSGPNNYAGESVMHFSPGEWYIHIGSPDNPVGIKVIGMLNLESYFMVGDNLPGSLPPPSEVSKILGGMDLDYMADENSLKTGKGIAFGARITMDTGNLKFLIFYARFNAGLGFDVMLKNYGSVQCIGRSDDLGINGWYANGQAYAYFSGKIGIVVKVFRRTKRINIINLGMAAVMQAKLPNPFWMNGIVGGHYSVLGGLVKGNCKFEVTIGEKCEMVQNGSVLEGLDIIADMSPLDNKTDVDVFNSPQAVFNMEIDKVFEMVDYDEVLKAFRVKLDHFRVLKDNQPLEVNYKWNEEKNVLVVQPVDILPGKSTIKAIVQVSFEERDRNIWKPVSIDGAVLTETREVTFTTGEAPDYIPLSNIKYCYPILNHYNFYQSEYPQGYVQLKQGQDYLFESNADFVQKGRFTSSKGELVNFDIVYKGNNEIEYNIPSGLIANTIYTFDIISMPKRQDAIDQNISTSEKTVDITGQDLSIRTRKTEGEVKNLKEKMILTTHFRTSYYTTLKQKLDDMFISTGFRRNIHSDVHELGVTIFGKELFEKYETHWTTDISPLIQFEAILSDSYYINTIESLIYKPYNAQSILKINWRNEDFDIGFPPTKALYIRQIPLDKTLTQSEIDGGYSLSTANEGAFVYNLIWFYANDFLDIQGDAAYQWSKGNTSPWHRTLIDASFPMVKSGTYPFDIKYVVPGREEVSSKYRVNIKNTL